MKTIIFILTITLISCSGNGRKPENSSMNDYKSNGVITPDSNKLEGNSLKDTVQIDSLRNRKLNQEQCICNEEKTQQGDLGMNITTTIIAISLSMFSLILSIMLHISRYREKKAKYRNSTNKQKSHTSDRDRIQHIEIKQNNIDKKINLLEEKINTLEYKLNRLIPLNIDKVSEPKHLQSSVTEINPETQLNPPQTREIIQSEVLYADSIQNDSFFNHVSKQANDDTVFELKLESDILATFSIYEGAHKRVLKNSDFIDGCEKQHLSTSPTKLELEVGTAELIQEGKWKVKKKLKVKFV